MLYDDLLTYSLTLLRALTARRSLEPRGLVEISAVEQDYVEVVT
jgi:hypothetical protein